MSDRTTRVPTIRLEKRILALYLFFVFFSGIAKSHVPGADEVWRPFCIEGGTELGRKVMPFLYKAALAFDVLLGGNTKHPLFS